MNHKLVIKIFGLLLILIGISMLPAILFGIYYREFDTYSLLYSLIICVSMGGIMFFLYYKENSKLYALDAFFIVGFGWIIIGAFGALPYILSGVLPNFFDAFFETISGFTTTGASVLTDIESVSKSILFWRSFTHWLGGMGIIVLFVALFPFLGVGGKNLINFESPGPIKSGLKPRVVDTARYLWYIYFGLTIIETILLMFGGMNFYNASCHTFGTMATGGFSTLNKSIAGFQSRYIDAVITIFMILAGVNFSLYYFAIISDFKNIFSVFFKDIEFKIYISIIIISTFIIGANIYINKLYPTVLSSLRYSAFQVVSIMTTTGYATADFNQWSPFCKLILLTLMFIGGCAGSTGGGMKVIRIIILCKFVIQQIFRTIHPNAIVTLKISNQSFPKHILYQVLGFFVLAILIFVFSSLFISLFEYDIETSTSAVIATLWNIGPGISKVGPVENFAFFPNIIKLLLSLLMIIGRLEIFTILVLLSPAYWRR